MYILQELFKNKGDPHELQSYTNILLANTSGKHFSRSMRMNIVQFLHTFIIDSMCGGFKKRGTDVCPHYLRAMSSFARRSAMSSVTLFVDIRSAFASVSRALFFS